METLGTGTFVEGDANASGAYDGKPDSQREMMSGVIS